MESCPVPEELQRLLQDAFSAAEDATLERHLRACPGCRRRLEEMSEPSQLRLPAAGPEEPASEDWLGFLAGLAARPPRPDNPEVPPSAAALPSIPGYEVLSELGRGGMGVVYKARHQQLRRLVALKCLHTGASANATARFRREARVMAGLAHPNLVQVHDVGEHQGRPYFAMEFVAGGKLSDKLVARPAFREAAACIAALAQAMQVVHDHGIVHRDLKPANILLQTTEDTENTEKRGSNSARTSSVFFVSSVVKIADFGLAKWDHGEPEQTYSGEVLGTPAYMAPEQAAGEGSEAGPAADVYALGAILYEMLAGEVPFKGKNLVNVVQLIRTTEAAPPTRPDSKVPRDLQTICLKCLQKEPSRRYASAAALADDLQRFLDGRPILARRAGPVERLLKWARRKPVAAALLVAILVGFATSTVLAIFLQSSVLDLERALQRETAERQRAETAEKKTRDQAHAEGVAAARTAVSRGLWEEGLRRYDQAIAQEYPDRKGLAVERLRCLLPSRDQERLSAELNRLRAEGVAADLAPQLLLYEAIMNLTVQGEHEQGYKVLRQVLAQPERLPPADRLYAQGLLAETSSETVALLRQALHEDPFHHPARSALLVELLVTGRRDEVRREAAQMRDFYRKDPLPDYVLALVGVLEGDRALCDRHVAGLQALLPLDQHQSVRRFFDDFDDLLRRAEKLSQGENGVLGWLDLALRLPQFRNSWLQNTKQLGVPVPSVARMFKALDTVLPAQQAALFGNRPAAVKHLREAARHYPEATLLYVAAILEQEHAARTYHAGRDQRAAFLFAANARELAMQAVETPTMLPNTPFRFEARLLAAGMEQLLTVAHRQRVQASAVNLWVAPLSGHPWEVAVAAGLSAPDPDKLLRGGPWLKDQLHRLAVEARRFPRIRTKTFPSLVQILEPALALEVLRSWQEDEPDTLHLQRLRAQMEFRAGNPAAALQWAERALRHPRVTPADRKALHSLQANCREVLRQLLAVQNAPR